MTIARALILTAIQWLVAACAAGPIRHVSHPFVDGRDGRVYPTLKLGAQIWLGRDLSFAAPGSHCYEGRNANCPPDGRLYPWAVANVACPEGWHLPNEAEWRMLERHLGMPDSALVNEGLRGTDQGGQLRRGGTSGFSAPLSGYRRPDGSYTRRGERSAYWLSSPADATAAWHRDLRADDVRIYRSSVPIAYALSVRCLRDSQTSNARGVVRDSKIARGT